MRKALEDDELDRLLARPLPDAADGEFSHQVLARVVARRTRGAVLELVSVLATLAICAIVIPLPDIGRGLVQLTSQVADSLPLSIALAAIVLSFAGERILRE